MPDARCTRGLVRNGEWMRARAYRLSGGTRHPLRDGFTAYAALSPAIGLVCHRHLQIKSANLNASVEASGPHGFAVRSNVVRPARLNGAPTLLRPPHPVPRS
jgi:hypothetical protein